MSTTAMVGTVISAALVLGIVMGLLMIGRKLAPPAPQILADPERKKLPAPKKSDESVEFDESAEPDQSADLDEASRG